MIGSRGLPSLVVTSWTSFLLQRPCGIWNYWRSCCNAQTAPKDWKKRKMKISQVSTSSLRGSDISSFICPRKFIAVLIFDIIFFDLFYLLVTNWTDKNPQKLAMQRWGRVTSTLNSCYGDWFRCWKLTKCLGGGSGTKCPNKCLPAFHDHADDAQD